MLQRMVKWKSKILKSTKKFENKKKTFIYVGFQPAMETTEIETTTLNAQAKQELDQQMADLKVFNF